MNGDLETIFSNGLNSNCNYNVKLALSDIYNLMIEYKNEKKKVFSSMLKKYFNSLFIFSILYFMVSEKVEQGEFNKKFPDATASYSVNVDIKIIRLLLKKIEYFLSWLNLSME